MLSKWGTGAYIIKGLYKNVFLLCSPVDDWIHFIHSSRLVKGILSFSESVGGDIFEDSHKEALIIMMLNIHMRLNL